eukprot:m.56134 g.56134  ORF g.56134 m.56134 type:complete len:250 (-) comp6982_c0_seq1:35-784(-)
MAAVLVRSLCTRRQYDAALSICREQLAVAASTVSDTKELAQLGVQLACECGHTDEARALLEQHFQSISESPPPLVAVLALALVRSNQRAAAQSTVREWLERGHHLADVRRLEGDRLLHVFLTQILELPADRREFEHTATFFPEPQRQHYLDWCAARCAPAVSPSAVSRHHHARDGVQSWWQSLCNRIVQVACRWGLELRPGYVALAARGVVLVVIGALLAAAAPVVARHIPSRVRRDLAGLVRLAFPQI